MQLYFLKATYTNNVYKKSDFFLAGDYKLDSNKLVDANFRPDDGLSQFITSQITLPDGTSIRDHTHVIVPLYDKIYKIISVDYVNVDQYQITVDEDPFLGQYLTLETTDIFRTRSNDNDDFRGVNDVADQTLKLELNAVWPISPTLKTGRWALLFFQFNPDDDTIGLKFDNTVYGQHISVASYAELLTSYPEVVTSLPEDIDYYQRTAVTRDDGKIYQCVYRNDGIGIKWVIFQGASSSVYYFDVGTVLQPAKINQTDVFTVCIALPFETVLYNDLWDQYYLSYQQFIGPVDTSLIDIKIVSDLHIPIDTAPETYSGVTRVLQKKVTFKGQSQLDAPTYSDAAKTSATNKRIMCLMYFNEDIDISHYFGLPNRPLLAEPFKWYRLYVYGKEVVVPYYMTDDVHLLIAINSGVVNWLVYYNDKRNILASGSFTHSIKYQIDQLDAFYAQNPTYKEQFFVKMAADSFKTIAGGAIGGAMTGGPVGLAIGSSAGMAAAGVDAGISMLNLHYQEKGLKLRPDQMFGENSEVSLQVLNVFGVYWVEMIPENQDQMLKEYYLKGFPTLKYSSISDMNWTSDAFWGGNYKIVFGELKKVIRNEFTTAFINEKLKQGVVIIE